VPEGPPFSHDATSPAAADVWNLICADGELDISFRPSGFDGGYAQLAVNAHRLRVGETEVVADLADVIRSKESARHPKDLRVLPLLYRHQATRRKRDDRLGNVCRYRLHHGHCCIHRYGRSSGKTAFGLTRRLSGGLRRMTCRSWESGRWSCAEFPSLALAL